MAAWQYQMAPAKEKMVTQQSPIHTSLMKMAARLEAKEIAGRGR
jgi:hypothetical protein